MRRDSSFHKIAPGIRREIAKEDGAWFVHDAVEIVVWRIEVRIIGKRYPFSFVQSYTTCSVEIISAERYLRWDVRERWHEEGRNV